MPDDFLPDDFQPDAAPASAPPQTPAAPSFLESLKQGIGIQAEMGKRLLKKGIESSLPAQAVGLAREVGEMASVGPSEFQRRRASQPALNKLLGLLGIDKPAIEEAALDKNVGALAVEAAFPVAAALTGSRVLAKPTPSRITATQMVGAAKKGGINLAMADAEAAVPALRQEMKNLGVSAKDLKGMQAVDVMPEVAAIAKKRVDAVVESVAAPHAEAPVSGSSVAEALRRQADRLPPTREAEAQAIRDMADNYDRSMKLSEWNSERVQLAEQTGPQYRKSPAGQAELPSVQRAKAAAYSAVRDLYYDTLEQLTGRKDLRSLKRQEGSLIKVQDAFHKVRQKVEAKQAEFESTDPLERLSETGVAISTFGKGAAIRRTLFPEMQPSSHVSRRLGRAFTESTPGGARGLLFNLLLGKKSNESGGGGGF